MGEELTLKEASERSGYSRSYLARMLGAGRIKGRKEVSRFTTAWYIDADSLAAYPATRQKPGIKPGTKRKQPAGAGV